MESKEDILKSIKSAKKQARKLKRAASYLFPEYIEYVRAKEEFLRAGEKLKEAETIWKNLAK